MRLLPAVLLIALLALAACPAVGGFPWKLQGPPARVEAAEVTTVGAYRRDSSRVLVRRVARPTRANLDHAAYHANIITRQAEAGDPIRPGVATVPAGAALFEGVVERDSIMASLGRTPLTEAERRRPLAFAPLVDYLARWNAGQATGLERARAAVRSESWGLPRRPGVFLQQITTLYLHQGQGWVKIELEPWARLFEQMPDEDGDGYPELYARLRPGLLTEQILRRIEQDYTSRSLSTAEVHTWANELASYWYPSHNTDVVKLQGQRRWPLRSVEPEVVKSSRALQVEGPTVVIRGKPEGRALYNVFVVAGVEPLDGKQARAVEGSAGLKPTPVTPQLDPLRAALEAEPRQHGSWEAWVKELAPVQQAIRARLGQRPGALKALIGRDGFLFYRRSLDYVVGGEIQAQPPAKNPLPAIVGFKDYLKGLGVDFLLVPVPTKAEVFPDRLVGVKLGAGPLPVINPHGRKFLLELVRAGVEVVDLLPPMLEARGGSRKGDEPLYQAQDTHWTDRGLRLAAGIVAERIRRYPWAEQLPRSAHTLRRTRFRRQGDLVSRLAEREQRRFRPASLVAHQVLTPSGQPFEDDASSPIVVLGDSFTGVYQRTDCGAAGISAHIAHGIQHPVDLVMSYGEGPNVRNKLLAREEKVLRQMRLVIWIFAARDFFNYWDDWAPLKQK